MPEHETVKNLTQKLVWLRLNSGEYVGINARGSRSVDKARLERNPAYDKLRKRGVIAVVAKEQEHEKKKKKARTVDKKEAAKDKTKDTPEDAQIEAAIDEMPEAPQEDKDRQTEDRADTKGTPPGQGEKMSVPEKTGVKKTGVKKKGKE